MANVKCILNPYFLEKRPRQENSTNFSA